MAPTLNSELLLILSVPKALTHSSSLSSNTFYNWKEFIQRYSWLSFSWTGIVRSIICDDNKIHIRHFRYHDVITRTLETFSHIVVHSNNVYDLG